LGKVSYVLYFVLTSELSNHPDGPLGVLICGHGSRNRLAIREFSELVKTLGRRIPDVPLEYGYLEFANPIISSALDKLNQRSLKRVIAIPAMLFAAGHVKNDIPSVLSNYSSRTGLHIDYGKELGINNLMIGAAGARIKEVIDSSPYISPEETLLVVVGRGSSDPDANSSVSKITRMLVEGFGFGWGETLFSGVTFPLVEPGLRHVIRLGFKRIIVFPYFLFSGVLVSRIREHTQRVSNDYPDIEFLSASYLGNHPLVLATFEERINDVLEGNNSMNCSLCKYRDKLLGFESEVSFVQSSHHHHVEGLVESCQLCQMECTGECQKQIDKPLDTSHIHSHSHHSHDDLHYPYPNKNHPLGPNSLR